MLTEVSKHNNIIRPLSTNCLTAIQGGSTPLQHSGVQPMQLTLGLDLAFGVIHGLSEKQVMLGDDLQSKIHAAFGRLQTGH